MGVGGGDGKSLNCVGVQESGRRVLGFQGRAIIHEVGGAKKATPEDMNHRPELGWVAS